MMPVAFDSLEVASQRRAQAGLAVLGGVISRDSHQLLGTHRGRSTEGQGPLPKGRLKLPSVVWGEAMILTSLHTANILKAKEFLKQLTQ